MTSTTVMTVRSRSTLRVDEDVAPPPSKRPRLHAPVSHRRKSSPDLLDTTIDDSPSKPIVPLRHSTRRPGPLSSPSFHTNAPSSPSSSHPPPATPRSKDLRIHRRETPSTTALFLRGGRESPDPLDTISPTTDPVRSPGRLSSVRRPAPTPESAGRRRMQKTARPSAQSPAASSSHLPTPAQTQPSPGIAQDAPPPASADQPEPQPQQQQRRSLRSHDGGSRARSELALYFPNYEQLLSFEPPKPEFLASQTKIKLVDDLAEPLSYSALPALDTESPFGNPLLNLHNCETISLPAPVESKETPSDAKQDAEKDEGEEEEDPLNEAAYFRAHRRNERQEKQLRNIERERAQHEKQQLERLVDELQGQDWLRVMGISGATDQGKKQYELKRDFFVKELSALIQKFKIWKEEEKRRKADKEKLRVESAEDLDATPQQQQHHQQHPPSVSASTSQKRRSSDVVIEDSEDPDESPVTLLSDAPSSGETPDVNDVDAWAARQLHQEARSATAGKKPKSSATTAGEGGRKKSKPSNVTTANSNSTPLELAANAAATPTPAAVAATAQPLSQLPPPIFVPDKPFTSFFSKRHVRDAALSTHRKGRVRLAFGHPVPEPEGREFELPADILTAEAIDSCRRKRRRMKRASRPGT
ncbi:acetyltransferase SAS4-like domain-containing protein [Aspergillus affinis]|uniref:acetyltransferase SAS4-like domain-containing protein n=1 Tax=Aspergillus affinis TaxID=1070780 RepID=UPI0022FED6E7|nr:uncharacterized protein KD926_011760 [Aspergillus affinis]KAI9044789.1 hypothetical protein KD926_011760 [Aspergillus affinis]